MTRNVTTPSLLSRIFGRQPLALAAAAAVSVLTVDTAARAQAVDIQNPAVIAGQVSWNASANQWVFTAGHQAIIEYAAFNIYQGGHVEFIQPHANAAVLNRILGADPSMINGSLTANGKLFFVNPAGITFGQNAVVNAGQLYAAAGSISNADFVNGVNRFTNLSGDVANLGTIAGDGVALLGQHVANHGTILAPDGFITLAAADRVVLAPTTAASSCRSSVIRSAIPIRPALKTQENWPHVAVKSGLRLATSTPWPWILKARSSARPSSSPAGRWHRSRRRHPACRKLGQQLRRRRQDCRHGREGLARQQRVA